MNNFVWVLLAVSMSSMLYAQEETQSTEGASEAPVNDYNRKALDFGLGVNKPFVVFTPGYSTGLVNLFHIELGYRYMLNPKFGLRVGFAHETFRNRKSSDNEFVTNFERLNFEVMLNIARICNFEDFTQKVGVFLHGGVGLSGMFGTTALDAKRRDFMGNVMLGVTPKYKLSERMSLTGDLSMVGNVKGTSAFDMKTNASTSGFGSYFITMSVGMSYSLGKGTKNMEWKGEGAEMEAKMDSLRAELESLKGRVDGVDTDVQTIENNMKDDDSDGVANYLDIEPNTKEGAVVNTKGQEVIMPKVDNLMEEKDQGLFYTVQLGVFSKMIPEKYWRNIAPMYRLTIEDGTNRYFTGVFHSVEEATAKLAEAKSKGIEDAFITAYYKGKRITVAEADLLLSTQGPGILRPKE